jgi:hypothetical protein
MAGWALGTGLDPKVPGALQALGAHQFLRVLDELIQRHQGLLAGPVADVNGPLLRLTGDPLSGVSGGIIEVRAGAGLCGGAELGSGHAARADARGL